MAPQILKRYGEIRNTVVNMQLPLMMIGREAKSESICSYVFNIFLYFSLFFPVKRHTLQITNSNVCNDNKSIVNESIKDIYIYQES